MAKKNRPTPARNVTNETLRRRKANVDRVISELAPRLTYQSSKMPDGETWFRAVTVPDRTTLAALVKLHIPPGEVSSFHLGLIRRELATSLVYAYASKVGHHKRRLRRLIKGAAEE